MQSHPEQNSAFRVNQQILEHLESELDAAAAARRRLVSVRGLVPTQRPGEL